jgi:hypothetical protein
MLCYDFAGNQSTFSLPVLILLSAKQGSVLVVKAGV